ncbi:MAG: hypothetical protein H0T51_21260 [Pirellulales bacterium]|nr:hypothetical protein [Pirellulales bacterium]
MKWISLLLAAGADPYSHGVYHFDSEQDAATSFSALDLAALHGHFEVFELKRLRLDPRHSALRSTMHYSCKEGGFGLVERLLQAGLEINDQENGGCTTIQSLVAGLGLAAQLSPWSSKQESGRFDTSESREKLKAIHLLAKYGARWAPKDIGEIKVARRSLLKMTSDYTVEFMWIIGKYKACSRDAILELLHTPSMRTHVGEHEPRIRELLAAWSRYSLRFSAQNKLRGDLAIMVNGP